ncbi:hypothetical protein MMPV_006771 [Pyropia vietnamensis]
MRVAVLGASGPVGAATVRALLDHPATPAVVAITRHPPPTDAAVVIATPATATATAPAGNEATTAPWPVRHPRLTVLAGSVADAAGVGRALANSSLHPVDALFIVPPPSPSIGEWVAGTIAAAAVAGVPHVAVLSVLRREGSDAPYGEWFRAMEDRLAVPAASVPTADGADSSPPPCVLRAAMFYENLLALRGQLRLTGVLVGVSPPDAVTPSVAVADLAAAAAAVCTTPSSGESGCGRWPHAGVTYDLISDAPTNDATAAALSAVVPRPVGEAADEASTSPAFAPIPNGVRYKQVPEAEAVAAAMAAGVPEWTAAALVELAAATASGAVTMRTESGDLRALLGAMRGGMDVATWVHATAGAWAAL